MNMNKLANLLFYSNIFFFLKISERQTDVFNEYPIKIPNISY